jgi:D-tyrosyl-tRNA(Tyr) deacylase
VKAVVQRVDEASVSVEGAEVARIGPGLLVFLGVAKGDDQEVADQIADRILKLRIFGDQTGRMSDPVGEREILCVSQFTLLADTESGNRPGFSGAAPPDLAEPLYHRVCERLGARRGVFGAAMKVGMVGNGPVTILLDR